MQSQHGLQAGVEVDGYRIEGVLGRGGMGIVYKAEDVALSRLVALKVIDPALARDEAFIRRFRSEARALARIDSPHIVSIHTLRQTEAGMFIVMEYVDGGTLGDVLTGGPVAWEEAYPLIRQMLLALEQAHGVGVIHRDIKPGNIMLSNSGAVKVTDFGLAKVNEGNRASTVTQGVAGTLYYMSPEQVRGLHDLDHRSDLYAVGMTIYEMLAGQLPFNKDESDFAIMRTIVEKELPPPASVRSEVPEPVSDAVMRALQKSADDRYQDAREMREAFEQLAAGSSVAVGPSAGEHKSGATGLSAVGRRMLLLTTVVVVIALVGASGLFFYWGAAFFGASEEGESAYPAGQALEDASAEAYMLDGELLAEQMQEPPALDDAAADSDEVGTGASQADRRRAEEQTRQGERQTGEPEPTATLATLQVSAADVGVRITSGGMTRTGAAQFKLPPGTHTVVLEHPTYGERRERVVLEEGDEKAITYYFTGEVSVPSPLLEDGSDGPWAKIWIDGETQDDWFTPKTITLGPGTHTVTLRKTGYEIMDNNQQVSITPGFRPSEHSLTFRMRKQ